MAEVKVTRIKNDQGEVHEKVMSIEKITIKDRDFEITSEKPLSSYERDRVKVLINGEFSGYRLVWKKGNWYKTKINIYSNVKKTPEFHEVIMVVDDKITFQLPRDFKASEETIYINAPVIVKGITKAVRIVIQKEEEALIPCTYPRGYEITIDYPSSEDLKRAEEKSEIEWKAIWAKIHRHGKPGQ